MPEDPPSWNERPAEDHLAGKHRREVPRSSGGRGTEQSPSEQLTTVDKSPKIQERGLGGNDGGPSTTSRWGLTCARPGSTPQKPRTGRSARYRPSRRARSHLESTRIDPSEGTPPEQRLCPPERALVKLH